MRNKDRLWVGCLVYIDGGNGDLQRFFCISVNPLRFKSEAGIYEYTDENLERDVKAGKLLIEE